MRKDKLVTTKLVECFCDFCEKQSYHACSICDKDCCNEHAGIHPEDCYDDYPRWICNQCHKIGEKYLQKLWDIEEKYENDKEFILTKWKEEAILNKGQKK